MDFAFNVNGTVPTVPSKIFKTFADKYMAEEGNGGPVHFKNTLAVNAYRLSEQKIDMYGI